MIFIALMIAVTVAVAASAGLFSVIGLLATYSGVIAASILAMGISLEMAKLMIASALYRYWTRFGLLFKSFLLVLVVGLMVVTSAGIFGYLTVGYQKDSVPLGQIQQKIDTDQKEVDRLIARKKEIDDQIAKLPNNYVNARQKLMTSFDPELKTINPRIDTLQKEIAEYQDKKVTTETKIGPIIYVAKVLHTDPDESIFYFTFLLMCVFDPAAVGLTLATNIALKARQEEKDANSKELEEKIEQMTIQDHPSDPLPPKEPELSKDDVMQMIRDASPTQSDYVDTIQRKNKLIADLRK